MATPPWMQKLQKLPTRQKIMGAVAIVSVIVGGWYMLIYKPKKEELVKFEGEVKQQQQMVTVLQKKYDSFQELKKEVDELRAKANVTVVLPSRAELPAFFDALQSDSTLAGVQIVKWENQPEVPFTTLAVAGPAPGTPAAGGNAVMASATPGATAPGAASSAALAIKVPVAIVVTGSYQQINRYFYAIYGGNSANPTDKRLISIEALTIKPVLNSNQLPTGQLVAGFVASTFRQPDAPMAPVGPGAARQPQGAKAAVVGARQTTEARGDVGDKMEK